MRHGAGTNRLAGFPLAHIESKSTEAARDDWDLSVQPPEVSVAWRRIQSDQHAGSAGESPAADMFGPAARLDIKEADAATGVKRDLPIMVRAGQSAV